MPTDVVMPQMGESITEGTITKWLKKPGDTVQRDEPLFEISTDKVDAEIPSPVAGTLGEIKVAGGHDRPASTPSSPSSMRTAQRAAAPAKADPPPLPAKDDTVTPAAVRNRLPRRGSRGRSRSLRLPATAPPGPGTEVLMPQMGESITEGTITKWLKKVGDTVQRDEPIFEISTDKVDAEIPSPVAGTLTEIKVREGATVTINTVVAVIGGGAAAPAAKPAAPAAAPAKRTRSRSGTRRSSRRSLGRRASALLAAGPQDRQGEQRRSRARSPAPAPAGRITKKDILGHLEGGAQQPAARCTGSRSTGSCSQARRSGVAQPHARRARPDDEDALHHRAAHGRVQAHQPARPHRLQGGHDPHRQAAREGEERSTSSATASS